MKAEKICKICNQTSFVDYTGDICDDCKEGTMSEGINIHDALSNGEKVEFDTHPGHDSNHPTALYVLKIYERKYRSLAGSELSNYQKPFALKIEGYPKTVVAIALPIRNNEWFRAVFETCTEIAHEPDVYIVNNLEEATVGYKVDAPLTGECSPLRCIMLEFNGDWKPEEE